MKISLFKYSTPFYIFEKRGLLLNKGHRKRKNKNATTDIQPKKNVTSDRLYQFYIYAQTSKHKLIVDLHHLSDQTLVRSNSQGVRGYGVNFHGR